MLEARDLTVQRGSTTILEIPYLDVREGEVLAVIGPNGAGKSTLLHVLALLHPRASGELLFDGRLVSPSEDLVKLRRRMAVVFQEPLLLNTSVRENVASGLRLRGKYGPGTEEKVHYWMKRFGVDSLARRSAHQLSGGEAHRVSLARAFVLQPDLLMLDEPFAALDAPTRASLFDDFERVLRESSITTLFVTHDRVEAMRLGDRVAVIIGGRLAQLGEPEEVFSCPADEKVAAFVGVENLLPGRIVDQQDGLAVILMRGSLVQVVSDLPVGQRVLVCLRPEDVGVSPAPSGAAAASVRNRLPGRITRLTPLGSQVRVTMDCGFSVVALVTRRSAEELSFTEGLEVVASFKASSAHLLPR